MTASGTVRWIAVFVWMAVIWALSDIPSLQSGLQPLWDTILRKFAHAGEFAVLAWLVFRALHGQRVLPRVCIVVVWTVGYAMLDEYHQAFVFGRAASLLDVFVDAWGGLLAALLLARKKNPDKR